MSKKKKPQQLAIGRIVHAWHWSDDRTRLVPSPAIVLDVRDENEVIARVFLASGDTYSGPLREAPYEDGVQLPTASHWSWPVRL